jgi:hypothetical protein
LKHSSATVVSNVAQVKPLEKLRDQQSGAINAEISAGPAADARKVAVWARCTEVGASFLITPRHTLWFKHS